MHAWLEPTPVGFRAEHSYGHVIRATGREAEQRAKRQVIYDAGDGCMGCLAACWSTADSRHGATLGAGTTYQASHASHPRGGHLDPSEANAGAMRERFDFSRR